MKQIQKDRDEMAFSQIFDFFASKVNAYFIQNRIRLESAEELTGGGPQKSGSLGTWRFGNLGIWKSGNLEMWDPKHPKNENSQNQNMFCPKCSQGLE